MSFKSDYIIINKEFPTGLYNLDVSGNTYLDGTLTVIGNINTTSGLTINDGTQQDGYVLTSDSGGTASWQPSSGASSGGTSLWEISGNTQLISGNTIGLQSEKIVDLGVATIGTDGASKDIAELEANIFKNKNYSSTSEYNEDFAQLDVPPITIGTSGLYNHVAFGILDYNKTNGNILLVYREGTNHTSGPSTILSKLSTDGGIIFGSPVTVVPVSGSLDYRNQSGGYTSTGRFVVIYDRGDVPANIYFRNSDNDGVSWSSESTISGLDNDFDGHTSGINNNILEFDDGSIGMPILTYSPSSGTDRRKFGIAISTDSGTTFSTVRYSQEIEVGTVEPQQTIAEPTMVQLADGIILCMLRDGRATGTLNYMYQYISYDYGNTWTYQGMINFDSSTPGASFVMLPKLSTINIFGQKVIVLTYTNRTDFKVKRIFGMPNKLAKSDGNLRWNDDTLVEFHTWASPYTADGNGTAVYPNGSFRGIYAGEDQISSSNASLYLFETPNDVEDSAMKLGISINNLTLYGTGVPAFTPYVVGQLYTDDSTGNVYTTLNVTGGTGGWQGISGGTGGTGSTKVIQFAVSDETTALITGSSKITFRMPYAITLSEVRASVGTASTGANLIVDINENGSTILSTKLSIDASEKTSTTAATPPVISDANLADDAEITIDIDQIGSIIAGAGLKITLKGTEA